MGSKTLKIQKILLACGILASLLYVATDIVASMLYHGYSYTAQQISELSAIGAPTRLFWIIMSFPFNFLLIAFGIGVSKSAGSNRFMRITGILLTIWGILGFVWLFFPMHMRGAIVDGSVTDTMHLVMAGVTVLLMTLFISFGAAALKKGFRLYSIASIVAMLVCGASIGIFAAPAIAAGQPTPWMGLVERVSVYSPLLWTLVLAFILLRSQPQISESLITEKAEGQLIKKP